MATAICMMEEVARVYVMRRTAPLAAAYPMVTAIRATQHAKLGTAARNVQQIFALGKNAQKDLAIAYWMEISIAHTVKTDTAIPNARQICARVKVENAIIKESANLTTALPVLRAIAKRVTLVLVAK